MIPEATLDRQLRPELMDGSGLPLFEIERALTDLDRVNATLCGYHASRRTLLRRIVTGPRCQTLLDLGTGSGQVSMRLKRQALRRRVELRVIGVDRKLSHLLFGQRRGNDQLCVVAEAAALPFRSTSVTWTFSNLLFHHFTPAQNHEIIGEMRRVAQQAAIVVDLRRAFFARFLIRLLLPLLRVGRVASYDGKLSTDQAWCLKDVAALTAELPAEELQRRFPFRFSLVLRGGQVSNRSPQG